MKTAILMLAFSAATLTACAYPDPDGGGNPNHFAYAGDPGSVYDRSANPPRDFGQVTYNPDAPLPNNLPADETLPAPATPSEATAPIVPTPANPSVMHPATPVH